MYRDHFIVACGRLVSLLFFSCSGDRRVLHSFPTRRSSDLPVRWSGCTQDRPVSTTASRRPASADRSNSGSEEHTSELQSHHDLVCRLLLEKKKNRTGPSC